MLLLSTRRAIGKHQWCKSLTPMVRMLNTLQNIIEMNSFKDLIPTIDI